MTPDISPLQVYWFNSNSGFGAASGDWAYADIF